MVTIKASAVAPTSMFNLNGLDYPKTSYDIFYRDQSYDTQGNIDEDLLKIGIRNKYTNDVLQTPVHYSSYTDGVTPFTDWDSLWVWLVSVINFNTASGGSGVVTQTVTNYSTLADGTTVGSLSYVLNAQGTSWLPLSLGGTYYPEGFYVWDGVKWVSDKQGIAEGLYSASNQYVGWRQYADTLYNNTNQFALVGGVRTKIPNNGLSSLDYVQVLEDGFYDPMTQKLHANNDGDAYMMRVGFFADPQVNNSQLTIELDIGGTQGVIWEHTVSLNKGAGVDTRVTETVTYFTGNTFIANGGELFITCDSNCGIYDVRYFIQRTYRNI